MQFICNITTIAKFLLFCLEILYLFVWEGCYYCCGGGGGGLFLRFLCFLCFFSLTITNYERATMGNHYNREKQNNIRQNNIREIELIR